jgi:hypothetical protein
MKEPLPPLLERTAAILADSARLLLQIEDSIAPLLARPPHGSTSNGTGAETVANFRSSVVSLQKIDLLSQTLEDLSFWLDDLAQSARHADADGVAAEQAMTRLRLADLRQRLLGQCSAEDRSSTPVLF